MASSSSHPRSAVCRFRVTGRKPELWDPETGVMQPAAAYDESGGITRIPIRFQAAGSIFVIFRPRSAADDPIVRINRYGQPVWAGDSAPETIEIVRAAWGPAGDRSRTRDVTAQLRRLVRSGVDSFLVSDLAKEGDPAYMIVKTLRVEYKIRGRTYTAEARDPETISLEAPTYDAEPVRITSLGSRLWAECESAGEYSGRTRSGREFRFHVPAPPAAIAAPGPWTVRFPTGPGGTTQVEMQSLVGWNRLENPEVRYLAGAAEYETTLFVPRKMLNSGRRVYLDLGKVEIAARVSLNGRDLGILWKPPYRMDVTGILRPGGNRLKLAVTNLPVNRMIGDEELAEDSDRNPNGTLRRWPEWVKEGRPSPTGRHTFAVWRLWKKGERLVESGLLGPVTLRASEFVRLSFRPIPSKRGR